MLNKYFKGVERQDVSSTSRGAQIVAEEGASTNSAAISSRIAAEHYDLDILVEAIENKKGNATRFLVIQRISGPDLSNLYPAPTRYKTLVTFTLEDNKAPGALADVLAVFKKHDLNLTSINTRPSGERMWTYIFFVELWGVKITPGKELVGKGDSIRAALKDLASTTRSLRWLGSWKSFTPDQD